MGTPIKKKNGRETKDLLGTLRDAAYGAERDFIKVISDYHEKKAETEWKKIYTELKSKNSTWSNEEIKLTNEVISLNIGVSRSTVERFSNNKPKKRNQFILLCILRKVSYGNTEHLLTRLGYRGFYLGNIDDCIYSYMLNNNDDDNGLVHERFERIKKNLLLEVEQLTNESSEQISADSTFQTCELTKTFSSYEELCEFVKTNWRELVLADKQTIKEIRSRLSDKNLRAVSLKNKSFKEQYDKVVEGTAPISRDFIILLGIHLGYYEADINEFLVKCGFSELFSKDFLDATICYVLNRLELIFENLNEDQTDEKKIKEGIIVKQVEENGYAFVVGEMMKGVFERDEIKQNFSDDIKKGQISIFLKKLENTTK